MIAFAAPDRRTCRPARLRNVAIAVVRLPDRTGLEAIVRPTPARCATNGAVPTQRVDPPGYGMRGIGDMQGPFSFR
jgi:hypothetical protein